MVTRPCPRSIRTSLRKRRDAHNHAEVSPEFYAAAAGKRLLSGLIAAHQTFGDQLRWNPHHHCLVVEEGLDEHGTFIPVPLSGLDQMTEVFRRRLIRLLVEKELLSGELARSARCTHPRYRNRGSFFILSIIRIENPEINRGKSDRLLDEAWFPFNAIFGEPMRFLDLWTN